MRVLTMDAMMERILKKRSRQIYEGMIKRKAIPYDLEQFRIWLRRQFPRIDMSVECRYCGKPITIADCVVDHKQSLKHGGSVGMENLCVCCAGCNRAKGAMSSAGFEALVVFCELRLDPKDKNELFGRLKLGGRMYRFPKRPVEKKENLALPF